jgi:hypothetical protein
VNSVLEKTEQGWTISAFKGNSAWSTSELCFMADLQHGFALFPGTREHVSEKMNSIRCEMIKQKAKQIFDENVCLASLPDDVDESEAEYMLVHSRLPRRVAMRLRKKLKEGMLKE